MTDIFDPLPFDRSRWASDSVAITYANCYGYALGDIGLVLELSGWGNPGNLLQVSHSVPNQENATQHRESLIHSAIADGLIHTGPEIKPAAGFCPVALFCAEMRDHFDFHWIRMNPDGTWSQKHRGKFPELAIADHYYSYPIRILKWGFDIKISQGKKPVTNPSIWEASYPDEDGSLRIYKFASYFNVPRQLRIKRDLLEKKLLNYQVEAECGKNALSEAGRA